MGRFIWELELEEGSITKTTKRIKQLFGSATTIRTTHE